MSRIQDSLWSTGENKPLGQAFIDACVEFVVVGGLAVSWYWSERQADDMDLLLNPTPDNSIRVVRVLQSQYMNELDGMAFARPNVQMPLKKWNYAELLTPRNDGESYIDVSIKAVQGKLFDLPVLIATKETIIAMKCFADGTSDPLLEKHRQDLKALRALI
jgi:hypothetical protein